MKQKPALEEVHHAEVCLATAKMNLREGFVDACFNRLYYTVFHSARALAVNRGHVVKSHKGLFTIFGMDYIKTGVFEKGINDLYRELIELRATADYGHITDLDAEEAAAYVPQVEAFLERAKAQLATESPDASATGQV